MMPSEMLLPKRTSVIAETVSTLKNWILGGHVHSVMPGEQHLKQRLGVGRDTVRLALRQLQEEQWITGTTRGKKRTIREEHLSRRRHAQTERLPVTFLSPFPVVDGITFVEMDELQRHLAEQRRHLRYLTSHILKLPHPERHLQSLVRDNPSSAWILYLVGEKVLRWFEEHNIPACIYGMPEVPSRLPYVANDWESGAYHAGLELVRNGHQLVAQLGYNGPTAGVQAASNGLRRALANAKPAGRLVVSPSGHTPSIIVHSLEAIFRMRPRPTALVFSASNQLLTSMSWMIHRRIGVPDDVSIICLPNDTWFDQLEPPVSYYANNSRTFARLVRQKVMELIETGRVSRSSNKVRLEYHRGKTVGPAPQESG